MTVRELKSMLDQYPEDMEVVQYRGYDADLFRVDSVYKTRVLKSPPTHDNEYKMSSEWRKYYPELEELEVVII